MSACQSAGWRCPFTALCRNSLGNLTGIWNVTTSLRRSQLNMNRLSWYYTWNEIRLWIMKFEFNNWSNEPPFRFLASHPVISIQFPSYGGGVRRRKVDEVEVGANWKGWMRRKVERRIPPLRKLKMKSIVLKILLAWVRNEFVFQLSFFRFPLDYDRFPRRSGFICSNFLFPFLPLFLHLPPLSSSFSTSPSSSSSDSWQE